MPTLPRLTFAALIALATSPVMASENSDWTLSGEVGVMSDYVWRGISQTQEDPTWKLAALLEHDNGFYVGTEYYGVDFVPAGADYDDGISFEGNVYVGWNREFSDNLSLDVNYNRIFYPGSKPGYNSNFEEITAVLGFAGHYSLTANYSDNTVNLGHSAWYWALGGEWDLGDSGFSLATAVGSYDLGSELGGSYRDYTVSLARDFGPVTTKLSWHDTSGYNDVLAESLGEPHLAKSRVVLSLGIGF